MSKRRIQPGDVVWAVTCDRNGQNSQERPLLAIPPAPLNPLAIICALAISTDPKDDPSDPAIELPWDANTGSTTGLYEFSRVVLLWPVPLEPVQVTQMTGRITAAELKHIVEQREIAKSFRPAKD
jgi:hypothetical protein